MIIWINGAFGAGKTTLAEELSRRLPEAVLFDPEYVGYMLRYWVPVPTGDFQDLPSWRELVVATALSLRKHHSGTLIARDPGRPARRRRGDPARLSRSGPGGAAAADHRPRARP
jgi:hypothetical protein